MNDGYNTYLGKAYRFLSFEGLFKTVENRSLRFTRVDKFNDPLDNNPIIAPLDWDIYKNQGGEAFQNFAKEYVFSKIFKSLFICCFCKEYKSNDSYLMWSHYGKSHSQVCFEIDFKTNKYLGGPSEVQYPESLVSNRDKFENTVRGELGLNLVTNKLKQWSYEKEVRLIVDIKSPKIDFSKLRLCDSKEFLYVDFDLRHITKVFFGVKSELFNELKTRSLFMEKGLKPEYEKLYIDPETLSLESKPYDFE